MTETIKNNWLKHFITELQKVSKVYIISPFINYTITEHLIKNIGHLPTIKILTRFNLNDFKSKASNLDALQKLVENGIEVKGIKSLHSKVYLFDNKNVIIGSANFTSGGFFNNYEYGIKSCDNKIISDSKEYFDDLWNLTADSLTLLNINDWKHILNSVSNQKEVKKLPDFGIQASLLGAKNKKVYIKFFGKTEYRESLEYHTIHEIERSHCHYAVTFSGKRGKPRRYNDGDVIYMARMLNNNDCAIFGKATALKHIDKRDEASAEDIAAISWKKEWPVYIRVKDPEFINGKMSDCPKLKDLINNLSFDSFSNTQKRFNNGEQNFNVKDSLRRQADIQLSDVSAEWLENEFQEAILKHSKVPQHQIDNLYQGIPSLKEILKLDQLIT